MTTQKILFKIAEIKAGIQNGSIIPKPEWDLDETFDAFMEPYYLGVLSVNGTIAMVLHVIVFWLFLFRTPKEMNDYKMFLFNISIWSLIHDIQLTVFWKPIPLFPITGAFVAGPSKFLGDIGGHYGLVGCIMLVTVYISSMFCGIIYRLFSLLDKFWYKLIMSWFGLICIIIIHATPVLILGTMMSLCYVDANFIRAKALKRFPQLEPIVLNEAIFGYDIENQMMTYFFIVELFFIFVVIPLFSFGCVFPIYFKLRKMRNVISERTYKLHKTLLLALCVQIFLQYLFIIIPNVFIVIGTLKEFKHVNLICEATLMLCTCHSG